MNEYFNIFLSYKYIYIVYLFCVLFMSTIAKQENIFQDIYTLLFRHLKSKKLILLLVSCISGILPVPGRIIISAGIMDTLTNKSKNRKKIGILNYLATHHYYLWSPLEKSVIIPIAVFGLTYIQFMHYTIWPLIISIAFCLGYLMFCISENDITFNTLETYIINKSRVMALCVSLMGIICLTIVFNIYTAIIVASIMSLLLLIITRKSIVQILKQINYKVLGFLYLIILLANLVGFYQVELTKFVEEYTNIIHKESVYLGWQYFLDFSILCLLSFSVSWILGSSEKYVAISSMICGIIGIKYLTFFMILNFCAYLVSPTHKCITITNNYFGTTYKEFLKVIILWIIALMTYSTLTLF